VNRLDEGVAPASVGVKCPMHQSDPSAPAVGPQALASKSLPPVAAPVAEDVRRMGQRVAERSEMREFTDYIDWVQNSCSVAPREFG
jgi:hypothetical protein